MPARRFAGNYQALSGAAAGASVPTLTSYASSSSASSPLTDVIHLFDNDDSTRWQTAGEIPARLMVGFSGPTYLEYIDFRSFANGNFTPAQMTLDYSDTGISGPWTDSGYGTLTIPGYPYADGAFGSANTARFTTPGTLLKQYWRMNIPIVAVTGYDSGSGVVAISAQFYHTSLSEPMVP